MRRGQGRGEGEGEGVRKRYGRGEAGEAGAAPSG